METVEDLQSKFEYYAEQHYAALQEGGGSRANKWYKKIVKLHELSVNIMNENIFKRFLSHENECVRFWAACFCLQDSPQEAQSVLKKLLKSSEPYISISAKANLESFSKSE